MSVISDIWEATDTVCNKCGIGGSTMPKNNSVTPSWSYTTGSDDIRVVESALANWELVWNGRPVAHSNHPATLIRWAYAKGLLDLAGAEAIADTLGIKHCHVFDNDR